MKDFVAYIIKNLVSCPEEVSVTLTESEEQLRIEIRVAQEDVGKVIGRRGNTINALRTIVRTVATRLGRRAQVELIQSDENEGVVLVDESPEDQEVCVSAEETQSEGCEALPEPALSAT